MIQPRPLGNAAPEEPPTDLEAGPRFDANTAAALEAQRRLLGLILVDSDAATEAVGVLKTPDAFMLYAPDGTEIREARRHALIYGAMLRVLDRGELVDTSTLNLELTRAHDSDAAGGASYLADLFLLGRDDTPAQAGTLARLVRDYGAGARAGWEAQQLQMAVRNGATPMELVERAHRMMRGLLDASVDTEAWPEPESLERSELPPFPVQFLPPWAREFSLAAAESIQVPVDLVGICVVGGLSVAAAGRLRVQVKPDYAEPCNLFVCGIGAPSSRKTSSLDLVQEPIEEAERELRRGSFGKELARSIETRRADEKRLKWLQDKAAKDGGEDADGAGREELIEEAARIRQRLEEEPEPDYPMLMTSSVTPESLAVRMQGQAGRLAVVTDEGSEIVGILRGTLQPW